MKEKQPSEKKIGKGKTTRITIDVPNDLYYAIKQKVLDERIRSTKAYLLGLAIKDLGREDIEI